MATVGEAQVRIVADARGFARDVEREVNRAIRNVDVDANPISRGISQSLDDRDIERNVVRSSTRVGRRWIEQFGIVLQGGISPRAAGAFGGVVLAALGPVLLTVGTVLGGLLITGMGAGIAGLGLFFAAQSQAVQNEFAGVFRTIGNQLAAISRPLIEPILDLADIILDTFGPFRVALSQAFEDLAPALSVFFRDMGRAFQAFAPAIQPITDAFIQIMEELGPELANEVFPDLADAIINLADAVGENADVFVQLLGWFLAIPEAIINFLAELVRITAWFEENPAAIIAALTLIGAAVGLLIAGPIGALVGAIIGIGIAILNLRDRFFGAWTGILLFLSDVFDDIRGFFSDFVRGARRAWNNFRDNAGNALDAVRGFFANLGRRVGNIWRNIRRGGNNLISWFRGLPGRIRGAIGNMFSGLWEGFRSAVNRIISGWNNLSLTLGGGTHDPLGPFGPTISIPSFTLSTPNVPFLQDGGIAQRSGAAVVGERGPELVFLPQGAAVQPLPAPQSVAPGADEFEATAIIDLGRGIQEVVNLTFQRVATGARANQRAAA